MWRCYLTRSCFPSALLLLLLTCGPTSDAAAADSPDPAQPNPTKTADQVDRLLAAETGSPTTGSPTTGSPAQTIPVAADEVYLRRVFLDLVGQPPTVDDVLAFSFDTDPHKRAKIVEQLLQDDGYGENWAHYWRDVLMYRRTDERALLVTGAVERFLTEELNRNTPWDKIATAFITSTGDARERGDTALIMAQFGKPEDVVAEISRIFMGIQIQCAQCHDHPTDRWKREQFHELAAF